jgi:hypothetical protein
MAEYIAFPEELHCVQCGGFILPQSPYADAVWREGVSFAFIHPGCESDWKSKYPDDRFTPIDL